MIPHTVTVFNVIETTDTVKYHRCVVNDVFHYEKQSITTEGKGEKTNSIYNVVFSKEALKKYVDSINVDSDENIFTLKENDIIVYGEVKAIEDLKDLQKSYNKYFLIKSISDNRYGSSDLNNILVTS